MNTYTAKNIAQNSAQFSTETLLLAQDQLCNDLLKSENNYEIGNLDHHIRLIHEELQDR